MQSRARPEHASCGAESWRACRAGSCSLELQRSRSLRPGNTVPRWRPGKSVERRDEGRGRGGEREEEGHSGRGEVRRGCQKGHTEELKREKTERQGRKTPRGCRSGVGVGGGEDEAVGTLRQQAGDKGARREGKTRHGQVSSHLQDVPTADKGLRFFLCAWVM